MRRPGGKVKASIDNPEWCENDAGAVQTAHTGRVACEGHVTTPVTTRHWGSYQVCVNNARVTVALAASSKTACTTQNSANTWHTAEVLDWDDTNDSGEWTLGGSLPAPTVAAQGAHSIRVGWTEYKGDKVVADYAVYGSFSNDYAGMTLAAVEPAGTKEWRDIGLPLGAKRYYAVFARDEEGLPIAMSGIAGDTTRRVGTRPAPGPNPYQDQAIDGDRHQYGVRGGGAVTPTPASPGRSCGGMVAGEQLPAGTAVGSPVTGLLPRHPGRTGTTTPASPARNCGGGCRRTARRGRRWAARLRPPLTRPPTGSFTSCAAPTRTSLTSRPTPVR